ncbi:hypothetical protein KR009_005098, partial [Drosophila setifemur]
QKRSFSKFDDLQKRSLIHAGSQDSNKTKKLFRSPTVEQHDNCRQCKKTVYKMEEVILHFKTGTTIFHKTCLRCLECSKQLTPESYHVHEESLYCTVHFKLIFAPKIVYEESAPRKPELIILENQPTELPPDVARASDKPDLGLDELQRLNVRSRFKVFENGLRSPENNLKGHKDTVFSNSQSIVSTLTKLQKNGLTNIELEKQVDHNTSRKDNVDDCETEFVHSVKEVERETPVGLSDAVNDILTRFEQGHMMSKEERREERKLEIQNIRSRLFLGKQAKIKEMYQMAVAESEQFNTSIDKIQNVKVAEVTRSIKDRFENGEIFNNIHKLKDASSGLLADADVFESGISKASRNIFKELDANNASNKIIKENNRPEKTILSFTHVKQENNSGDVIKFDSKPEEVKITTEVLTERYKFFEKYRPTENEKRQFRITPPPEGVVEMHTPDSDTNNSSLKATLLFNDNILQKTQTTSTILSKFREIEEQKKLSENEEKKLKPLKCFTPPPESGYYVNTSETDGENASEDEKISDDDEICLEGVSSKSFINDQALQEVRNSARAKQLRAKFEKWQVCEMDRELSEGLVDVYSQLISNDSIESAK